MGLSLRCSPGSGLGPAAGWLRAPGRLRGAATDATQAQQSAMVE